MILHNQRIIFITLVLFENKKIIYKIMIKILLKYIYSFIDQLFENQIYI